jgi:hypothetical protein
MMGKSKSGKSLHELTERLFRLNYWKNEFYLTDLMYCPPVMKKWTKMNVLQFSVSVDYIQVLQTDLKYMIVLQSLLVKTKFYFSYIENWIDRKKMEKIEIGKRKKQESNLRLKPRI